MRAPGTVARVASVMIACAALVGSGCANHRDGPYYFVAQPTVMDLVLRATLDGAPVRAPTLPVFGCETEECLDAVFELYMQYRDCPVSALDPQCVPTDILRAYVRTIFGDDGAGAAFIRYAESAGAACAPGDITVCTYRQDWCAAPRLMWEYGDHLISNRMTIFVDPASSDRPIIAVLRDRDGRGLSSREYEDCVLRGQVPSLDAD